MPPTPGYSAATARLSLAVGPLLLPIWSLDERLDLAAGLVVFHRSCDPFQRLIYLLPGQGTLGSVLRRHDLDRREGRFGAELLVGGILRDELQSGDVADVGQTAEGKALLLGAPGGGEGILVHGDRLGGRALVGEAGEAKVAAQGEDLVSGIVGALRDHEQVRGSRDIAPVGERAHGGVLCVAV